MQLRIPFLFTSFVLQEKLVGRSAEPRLPLFKTSRMAPAVAPATVFVAPGINIAFACYRNVTRIVSRRIHLLGNDTTRSEILVCCKNRICFHNFSFHAGGYVVMRNALHSGWLFLCKNCCAKNPLDRVSDRCRAKLGQQLPRDGEHHRLSRSLMKRGDKNDTRNSDQAAQLPRLGTR